MELNGTLKNFFHSAGLRRREKDEKHLFDVSPEVTTRRDDVEPQRDMRNSHVFALSHSTRHIIATHKSCKKFYKLLLMMIYTRRVAASGLVAVFN